MIEAKNAAGVAISRVNERGRQTRTYSEFQFRVINCIYSDKVTVESRYFRRFSRAIRPYCTVCLVVRSFLC